MRVFFLDFSAFKLVTFISRFETTSESWSEIINFLTQGVYFESDGISDRPTSGVVYAWANCQTVMVETHFILHAHSLISRLPCTVDEFYFG